VVDEGGRGTCRPYNGAVVEQVFLSFKFLNQGQYLAFVIGRLGLDYATIPHLVHYLHRVCWRLCALKHLKSNFASNNAQMGDEKSQRLDDALSSLVGQLIPLQDEDEATVEERREDALHLARNIIDGWAIRIQFHKLSLTPSASHGSPAVVSDVNHAADLIKKKRERRCHHMPHLDTVKLIWKSAARQQSPR